LAGWADKIVSTGEAAPGELFRLLAHDVNNPLTAIRIISEMLRDELDDDDQRRDMIDITEAADLAAALIESVALAAEEPSADDFTWFPLELPALLRQVIDRPALRRYVVLDAAGEVPMAGDRLALQHALTDVFINGRRLAGPNAKLHATLSAEGPRIEIVVHHPGEGIPESMRPLLFRADGAVHLRRNRIPVSASGLAYARAVVEGHGGTIGLEGCDEDGMNLVIRLAR